MIALAEKDQLLAGCIDVFVEHVMVVHFRGIRYSSVRQKHVFLRSKFEK